MLQYICGQVFSVLLLRRISSRPINAVISESLWLSVFVALAQT